MIRIISICAFFFLMAGCAAALPPSRAPDLTFAHVAEVRFNAGIFEIIDDYHPSMKEPNVEHLMSTPLYTVVRHLMERQVVAAAPGSNAKVRATIVDAGIVSEKLPVTEGFASLFMRQPTERYHARVEVRVEFFPQSETPIISGHAEVVAKRTATVFDGKSPGEREQALFRITEALSNDLAQALDRTMREKMDHVIID